ncbi:YisL family protein [Bacillus sp. S14(2024)]|uniref:YisL family protein n=1 Tax=Bacillus sp. S14(2024) TaxID=3162884 RepID=UPI003D1CD454
MLHMHITAWSLGIILFFVTYSMYKNGKQAKPMHMVVRLLYILIIVSGLLVYKDVHWMPMLYGMKMLGGIWVIAAMEMVLVKASKGKSTRALWIQFVIVLLVVLYLGLRLPLGFSPFA